MKNKEMVMWALLGLLVFSSAYLHFGDKDACGCDSRVQQRVDRMRGGPDRVPRAWDAKSERKTTWPTKKEEKRKVK